MSRLLMKRKKFIFASVVVSSFTKGIGNLLGDSKDDYSIVMWPFGKPNELGRYYVVIKP